MTPEDKKKLRALLILGQPAIEFVDKSDDFILVESHERIFFQYGPELQQHVLHVQEDPELSKNQLYAEFRYICQKCKGPVSTETCECLKC